MTGCTPVAKGSEPSVAALLPSIICGYAGPAAESTLLQAKPGARTQQRCKGNADHASTKHHHIVCIICGSLVC